MTSVIIYNLDECYICFENLNETPIKYKCKCKCSSNNIHSKCLFLLFMNNIDLCPLCRKKISPSDYFTKKQLTEYYYNLTVSERMLKIDIFNIILNKYYMFENTNDSGCYILVFFLSLFVIYILYTIYTIYTLNK
jgi:hypothetical protein